MAKVTSKYQVTIPREISKKYQIEPGDEIDWVAAGEVIRVIPQRGPEQPVNRESQLRWFDQSTDRHRKRSESGASQRPRNRGWTREALYSRGRSH